GFQNIAGTQTIGQMSEVVFMLLMPFFFARLGVKWMLFAGMGAWVLRYALFSLGAPDAVTWMIIAGIALHGICYDFFFVTGQIYVDKKSTPAIRGQAQGFLVLVTYGVGMLIGAQLAGALYNGFLGGADALVREQWHDFWLVPAAFAAIVMVFFGVAFRERARQAAGAAVAAALALLLAGGCADADAADDAALTDAARQPDAGATAQDTTQWIVLFDGTSTDA